MVGIAGKSKGCHTCRRRKVKCDEGKPFCERCRKASRDCEGYEKLAVFLNKTSTGWMKRKPMEEAICPGPARPVVLEPTTLNQQINLTPTWLLRIEEYFLEKYLPTSDASEKRSMPGYHVFQILSGVTRDPLLESTIEALCLTRVGRINKDDRLLQIGFQSYSLAIQRLYVAMSRENTRYSDTTLAAVKIMSIYEFYEPSYSDGRAVYNHTVAVERLLYGRAMAGYGRSITPAIKSLLKSSRYNSMVASIKGYSSNCPFARWKSQVTFRDSIEEYEHKLMDIGFMIAAVIRNYHFLREKFSNGDARQSETREMTRKCCRVYHRLYEWYASLAAWYPSILYQPADCSGSSNELHSRIQHLKFANITISHLLNDYWALGIIICWTIRQLSPFLISCGLFDNSHGDKCFQELHELALCNDDSKLLAYAHNILCSVGFSFRSNSGLAGQDHLFGLGIALRFSRMVPGLQAEDLGQKIFAILEKLVSNGLPFASCLIEQAEKKLPPADQLMQDPLILPDLRWGNGSDE